MKQIGKLFKAFGPNQTKSMRATTASTLKPEFVNETVS